MATGQGNRELVFPLHFRWLPQSLQMTAADEYLTPG